MSRTRVLSLAILSLLSVPALGRAAEAGTPAAVPHVVVSPESLSAEQCPDTQTSQTLSLCNQGNAPLEWNLAHKPSILHLTTTDTTISVERALQELGYPYELIFDYSDWTWIDFSPYDIVLIGMNGSELVEASLEKVRTAVVDQGKRVIFVGGSCFDSFGAGVDQYLVPNDQDNHCWKMSWPPQVTVVRPTHPARARAAGPVQFPRPRGGLLPAPPHRPDAGRGGGEWGRL